MSHRHHVHHVAQHHHNEAQHVTAFIQLLLPAARSVKIKWGVPIAVLIAQGALETGWGTHVKGNAYFGIKGKSPTGQSVNFTTHEVYGGRAQVIRDNFRAYGDIQDAADDYGRFLRTNPRYVACFAYRDDPDSFVDHLAAANYATDPHYADKVKGVIRAHNLAEYDQVKAAS
jgi:flagellar protein FlgJ